jgi:hypothetical protein
MRKLELEPWRREGSSLGDILCHARSRTPAGWKTSRALQGGHGCSSSKQGEQQQGRHGRGGAELPAVAACQGKEEGRRWPLREILGAMEERTQRVGA